MAHTYHAALPGYDERQLLYDGGCEECDERGKSPRLALAHLDGRRVRYAWNRAALWQQGNREDVTGPISANEAPVLQMLYDFQILLERTTMLPIGVYPDVRALAGWGEPA
jgi:hypothetical protein